MSRSLLTRILGRLVYDPCVRAGRLPSNGVPLRVFRALSYCRTPRIGPRHPLHDLLAASEWKSRFSISDGSLLWLWAHLKRHRPARILEMGSGISTLAFSFYASSYKSAASERSCVVSLEHDEKWVATTDKRLQEMNTRQFVTLLHCALGPVPVGGIEQSSYSVDCGRISELFGGKGPDLVLIDGPPGDVGRLATLPSILPLLTQRTEVFLDDAYRPGEQAIIARWQNTMSACLRYCGTFPLGNGLAYFVYHPKIRNGAPRT